MLIVATRLATMRGPNEKTVALVALGSNLGNRLVQLRGALSVLSKIPEIEIVRCSRVYETEPVGGRLDQKAYLNAVAKLYTTLRPHPLLRELLGVEERLGRKRTGIKNEARCIDLDLLAWGSFLCEDPHLVLPHPRLHQRSFVLEPLVEVAPSWLHPHLGLRAHELADLVRGSSWVRIIEGEKLWP